MGSEEWHASLSAVVTTIIGDNFDTTDDLSAPYISTMPRCLSMIHIESAIAAQTGWTAAHKQRPRDHA